MQPQRRLSKAWNEEFDVMKAMQDDRMNMHTNVTCHERCVARYLTNHLWLQEESCMKDCISKMLQATIITNVNFGKFEEVEASRPKQKKKGSR